MSKQSPNTPTPMTYSQAGVDISVADQAKLQMAAALETDNPVVLNKVGAFASLIDGRFPGIEHPVLVLKTEEPGSKQLLAAQHGRLASVGYDLVNHLLNDVVVMGARPVAVLDTIICGKLEKDQVVGLVRAMAAACRAQHCELVGGETSEQPRVIPNGSYILSAAALGVVDRKAVIDGSQIAVGDVVLAVPSNGLHTNGYTFVRSLLDQDPKLTDLEIMGERFIDIVLRPHLCYSNALQSIFSAKLPVHGLAHITGGGIAGNLIRVLPAGVEAKIDLDKLQVPPVFAALQRAGQVADAEMLRSFNMGAGLIAVLPRSAVEEFSRIFTECINQGNPLKCFEIGQIVAGTQGAAGTVEFSGAVNWGLISEVTVRRRAASEGCVGGLPISR